MISKVKHSILVCIFLFGATPSLGAIDCWWCKDSTLNKDVEQIKKRLDVIESKQNENNRAEVEALKSEIDTLKNQISSFQGEFNGKFADQQIQLKDSKEIEETLVKYGNNPDGMSALHYAIKVGDANAVKLLLSKGADVYSSQMFSDSKNTTPIPYNALTMAARYNQLEIAQILLNYGADVNIASRDDLPSALYYAAQFGSGDLVSLLLENGAIIDTIYSHPKHVRVSGEPSPLYRACEVGNYEAVVAFVNAGLDVNGNCNFSLQWDSPLDAAARKLRYCDNPQNLELVKFLVKNNARRGTRSYNENGHGNGYRLPCEVINGYLQSVGK